MDREEYLKTARDNAKDTALEIRLKELGMPSSDRGPLRARRMKLLDAAAEFQRDLILIDNRHQVIGRPDDDDKTRMAALRDRVRAAEQANLAASALISLANDVLDVIEEVRNA